MYIREGTHLFKKGFVLYSGVFPYFKQGENPAKRLKNKKNNKSLQDAILEKGWNCVKKQLAA